MRNRQLGVRAAIVAVVVIGGMIAGCATQPENASPPLPASPSPSPSVEPVVVAEPQLPFGGDCSMLLSDEGASADLGVGVTAYPELWRRNPMYVAALQLGGLLCSWSESEVLGSVSLSVIVLPRSVVDPERIYAEECTAGWGCTFATVAGEFVLFGVIFNPGADVEAVAVSHAAISARISNAVGQEPATKPFAPEGRWPADVDCSTLDMGGLLGAAVGNSAGGMQWGSDAEPNPGYYAALASVGAEDCGWGGGDLQIRVAVLPGGAWNESAVVASAPEATPISIPGAESALAIGEVLHVFAGVNWFTLTAEGVPLASLYPAASELVAELNALR